MMEMRGLRFSAAFALAVIVLFTVGCGGETGRQGVFLSPDGSLVADWYSEWGGGAAGYWADYVQLRKRGERFSVERHFVFHSESAGNLKIMWKSNTELEIAYPTMTSLFRSEARWDGVSISYREDPELRERGY
jgi:hypothetical protein